jgi:hypothetical protein
MEFLVGTSAEVCCTGSKSDEATDGINTSAEGLKENALTASEVIGRRTRPDSREPRSVDDLLPARLLSSSFRDRCCRCCA